MEELNQNDIIESYIHQLRELDWKYRKLERKYNRKQQENQKLQNVIKKQNRRISRLRGDKQEFHNEPRVVRKAKGKIK